MSEARATARIAVNPPVFLTSVVALLAFLCLGVWADEWVQEWSPRLLAAVTSRFGWFFVASVTGFILFAVWLSLSRYRNIRLGDDDERPEFSTWSWFAMLFSAGMGIGLVFYGVAEPMMHLARPPSGEPGSADARSLALAITFFHWGIHAWAIYLVVALAIAYFSFRRKLPLSLRSCFYPLFGERIYGVIGHLIDVIAVFGTLFGLATSLGIGAMQVSAGMSRLFGTAHTIQTQIVLIVCITLAATASLVSGVGKGIRRLSELNLALASLLLVFVFFVGPTGAIIDQLVEGVGSYARVIFERTLRVNGATLQERDWMQSWTLFYWGWWISWAPFVGMFIARVSRGRRIREMVLGVLLVPTGVTMTWFAVFGGTALQMEAAEGGIAQAVAADASTAVYVVLERLPLGSLTSLLAAAVVTVFFVTSSDSASFVVDMLTSGGHPNPPVWQRVFWATAEGATAATLLYAGGQAALGALQSAVISIGLPFCFCIVLLCVSLVRGLRDEPSRLLASQAGAVAAAAESGPALRDHAAGRGEEADVRAAGDDRHSEDDPATSKILVAVDRSPGALAALAYAKELTQPLEAALHVLHVAPRPADYLPLEDWLGSPARASDSHETLEQAAARAVGRYLAERGHGDVELHVRIGDPGRLVAQVAQEERARLVVVGRQGVSRLHRLGAVADRILRQSDCPVVVVP